MELVGLHPALESQMLEQETPRSDTSSTSRQSPAPLAPLFAVEFIQSHTGSARLFLLTTRKNLE